ncbi:unnamed protein product [Parnassius mnemosyne]|uniref:C2H2-type domain-containing protein n=1 Tax=Parnassius mnemosyne TaxID=213953 RepID=A0AAV1LAG2_9NEOP
MKEDIRKQLGKKLNRNKYYCCTCERNIIGTSYKFKCHIYTHNKLSARFTCEFCLKQFYRSDTYIRHLKVHESKMHQDTNVKCAQKIYICDVCSKSYMNKSNFIKHFRVHDSTFRPPHSQFCCKVCGIEYCENRLLVRHIRKTHFNFQAKESLHEKKLPNETWVEKVIQSDAYVEMTKITDNVIAIKRCIQINSEHKIKENGNSKTTDNKALYPEVKHYSEVVCNYCQKTMLKKSLLNHIREKHLKVRKFKCDTCNYKFNRRYQWINHTCGRYKQKPRREL